LHAALTQIEIHTLRSDVYYARIRADVEGSSVEVDARPSDAIALAIRAHIPMFVDMEVLEKAGIRPEPDITAEAETPGETAEDASDTPAVEGGSLSIFEDYINKLNLDHDKPGEDDQPGDEDN
jgi:bifunctional DNase/RNase